MSYKRDQMQIHKILKGQFVNLFINHVRKRNLYNDYRMIYLSDRIKLFRFQYLTESMQLDLNSLLNYSNI